MLNKQKIAVDMPCYNEEALIRRVLTTMPNFVDKIYAVDDVSKDRTVENISQCREQDDRIILIRHQENLKALDTLDWKTTCKRYGQPNDLLARLNIENFRVKDVPITPIYGVGKKSGIKPIRIIPHMFMLLFRLFWMRMFQKYVICDFHPLVFFYAMAAMLLPVGVLLGFYLLLSRLLAGPVAETSALFSDLFIITGLQFLFFGMWFDMESNKELKGS